MAYADLLTDVADTLDRDDVETRLPRWLRLVEAKLNRVLDDPEMEVTSEATATGTSTALPSDFGSMVSIRASNGIRLQQMGAAEFAGIDTTVTGDPRYYAIEDGAITFVPANSTTPIRMVYQRSIPPLTAADDTNWLLERAPDLYFYGVLVQAEAWDGNAEQAANWQALFENAIEELRTDAVKRKWGAGPLSPRIRRT